MAATTAAEAARRRPRRPTRRRRPSPDRRGAADQPIPAQPRRAPRTRRARCASSGSPARASGRREPSRSRTSCARACASSASRTRRSLVLFGATGDLAHRKVIPALYQLWRTNLLPHEFVLVAIGRRPYDDDDVPRRDARRRSSSTRRVLPVDDAAVARRSPSGSSTSGSTSTTPTAFDAPGRAPRRARRGARHPRQPALLPGHPAVAVRRRSSPSSGRVGLDHEHHDGGWRRIVIEKPFGHDLDSAKRLNREVGKVFRESQVYRIDHYLGKETVRNLLVFRFGNGIFEPLWNRRYVDHVQITVAESIGIENRGAFYEQTGAVARRPPEPPPPAASAWSRWSRRRRSRPTPCATRRSRSCARSTHDPDGRHGRRRPRPVRPGLGRGDRRSRATARSRRSTRSRRPRRSWPPG